MHDYYSMYTWAMDRQAALQREAQNQRLVRRSRPSNWVLQWPIARRPEQSAEREHHRDGSRRAA